MSRTRRSTRSPTLDDIPGFNQFKEEEIPLSPAEEEEIQIIEDAEDLGLEAGTLKTLEKSGFIVDDVFLVDIGNGYQTPYLKLEDPSGYTVYAVNDLEGFEMKAGTGTPYYTHDNKRR